MARELERKFLVSLPVESWPGELVGSSAAEISQGYLTPVDAAAEVRLRRAREVTAESSRKPVPASVTGARGVNQIWKLTIKGEDSSLTPASLDREEVEVALSKADFDAIWSLTAARRLKKVRTSFSIRSGVKEMLNVSIDEFRGPLQGLELIEVEFDTREQAAAFAVPSYFGEEVTDDRRYRNSVLASATHPPEAT